MVRILSIRSVSSVFAPPLGAAVVFALVVALSVVVYSSVLTTLLLKLTHGSPSARQQILPSAGSRLLEHLSDIRLHRDASEHRAA